MIKRPSSNLSAPSNSSPSQIRQIRSSKRRENRQQGKNSNHDKQNDLKIAKCLNKPYMKMFIRDSLHFTNNLAFKFINPSIFLKHAKRISSKFLQFIFHPIHFSSISRDISFELCHSFSQILSFPMNPLNRQ